MAYYLKVKSVRNPGFSCKTYQGRNAVLPFMGGTSDMAYTFTYFFPHLIYFIEVF